MNLDKIKKLDDKYFFKIYNGRYPLCFESGNGVELTDISGKTYIDFVAGIAVNCLGYNHPALVKAICDKAKTVMHCSNFYYVKEQAELIKRLADLSFGDKVFIANSGTEANEGAIKLARKYFYKQGISKYKVISLTNSFHGRTLCMVAATGQKKYQKPYKPLPDGFINVEYGNIDAMKAAIDDETCAILMELVQGEGGIILMDKDYVKQVRELCDEKGILLILDEVQTGIGRTGKYFAYEHFDIEPDIMTLAKGLGGGVPIGAVVATNKAAAFEPGDHGTTFGGNPLACASALAVLDTIEKDNLLDNVNTVGHYLSTLLKEIVNKYDIVKEHRGLGLMQGIEIDKKVNVSEIVNQMIDKGFLLCPSGENTLRIVPPLIIEKQHISAMVEALDRVLEKLQNDLNI